MRLGAAPRRRACRPPAGALLPAFPPFHWRPLSPARDGYAVATFFPDTATLSLDLLAASEPATLRMGAASGQLCEQLVAQWPGSRIDANTVSRLPQGAAGVAGTAARPA